MKKLKKAFTLTELVIVIAVIAILAAVLIPTYTSLVRKANISSDIQLARNMNVALSTGSVSETETITTVDSMGDVVRIIDYAGFNIAQLNPTTEGYRFVWDSTTNQILFLDSSFNVVFPEMNYSTEISDWWLPVNKSSELTSAIVNQGYNIYITKDLSATVTLTHLIDFGVDANATFSGTINYGTTTTAITTDSSITVSGSINGTLNVNTTSATITHQGDIDNVSLTRIGTYNETGFVANELSVVAGGVVVATSGYVNTFNNQSSTISTNNGIIQTYQQPAESTTSTITNNGFISTLSVPVTVEDLIADNSSTFRSEISTLQDMLAFAQAVNSGATYEGVTVKLMNDINISSISDWTPIGCGQTNNVNNYFAGTFDGYKSSTENYKIIGMTMTSATATKGFAYQAGSLSYADLARYAFGLFGGVVGGVIQNLELTNVDVNITSDSKVTNRYTYIGLVAGYLQADFTVGGTSEEPTYTQDADTGYIKNVKVSGDVLSKGRIAGIVGWMDSGIIEYCQNNANISALYFGTETAYGDASGIVSWIRPSSYNTVPVASSARVAFVDTCTNNGDLTVNGNGGALGGIVAANSTGINLAVYGCTNTGDLRNTSNAITKHGFAIGSFTATSVLYKTGVFAFTNSGSKLTTGVSITLVEGFDKNTTSPTYSEIQTLFPEILRVV